jgi:hypothetical protein
MFQRIVVPSKYLELHTQHSITPKIDCVFILGERTAFIVKIYAAWRCSETLITLVPDCVMSHLEDYNIHLHKSLKSRRRNITIRYIFSNLEGGRREKLHKYIVYVNFEVECHINSPSDLIRHCRSVMTVCESLTNVPFFVLCPSSTLRKKHDISEAGSASVFRQRSTQLGEPLRLSHSQSQSLGTTETFNVLKYEPRERIKN